jgi:peptide/nickel transport system substrate-binding protein
MFVRTLLRKGRLLRRGAVMVAALASITALAACGTLGPAGSESNLENALNVATGPTGPFVAGLSPFSLSDSPATMGVTALVYEPLLMYNAAEPSQAPKPWLASSYKWSHGGRTLTFTIPAGRDWSDGKPITARDVAFTFNLIKKYSALNVHGVSFTGASAPSATKAVLTFAGPAYTQLYSIAQVFIVPEHIWSKIKNPGNYANTKPVGSGPYLLDGVTASEMVFTRNPHYWQQGLPKVKTVRVLDYTSQQAVLNAMSAGEVDWDNVFMANIKDQWTDENSEHNKVWLPPVGSAFICPNTKVAPFNNALARRALALTFDRQQAVPEVENEFYTPATNPTGLPLAYGDSIPAAYRKQALTYNPKLAHKMFLESGMKQGPNGQLLLANGQPFKLSVLLPSSYTDWMSLGELWVQEMQAAGIDASLDGVSENAYTSDTDAGNYQVTFDAVWSSNGAYTTYNTMLNGALTAPIGKSAVSNIVRWNDPATNAALAKYTSTNDPAEQSAAIHKLATVVAEQAPIIPLMTASSFGSYSTVKFTGWPDAANPYQTNAISSGTPFIEDVVLHLSPRKGAPK